MRKLLFVFLSILLTACNLPLKNDGNVDLNAQAATIVAMTLQAQTTPSPEKTPTPTSTLHSTSTPTGTITPTYSVPMLKVNESTNCRTGPGQTFERVTSFAPGTSLEIVGRHPQENYWVVKIPGSTETCWIWGEYSTVTGSAQEAPTMTPPSAPTASLPTAPVFVKNGWSFNCLYNGVNTNITTNLHWVDRADNELGYRVYRNSVQVADLSANTTQYTDTFAGDPTVTVSFRITAYNGAGESSPLTTSFSCQ